MTNSIPVIKTAVKSRKEAFGGLIFTNRTPILSLNEDSYIIWEAIDGSRSIADICVYLSEKYTDKLIDENIVIDFCKACEDLDLLEFI